MPVESILVTHTHLDAKVLNGGRSPKLTGETLAIPLLEVGSGEAILVRQGPRAILIDGGSDTETPDNDAGARKMLARFNAGIRLEAVVASHPHQDPTNFYPELLRDAQSKKPKVHFAPGAVYVDNATVFADRAWERLKALGAETYLRRPRRGRGSRRPRSRRTR